MYALASLGLRCFLRGRRSTCCSARGRMYALASLGLRCSAGGFCVAGAALGALQGVGCTPWRPLVSAAFCVAGAALAALQRPWSPLLCRWLLRGRRGTWCSARGRMYAVPWSPVAFCVAGAALNALQGVGCTPWRPLGPPPLCRWLFAWQAQHLVLCKASDVRPGVPWSPPLCRWLLLAGAALGALPGVGCTPWRPLVSAAFCVAGAALGVPPPWRPLVSAALPVAFAWQVRHLVLCKGSDVRPVASLRLPPLCQWLFRGSGSSWCCARGRMFALVSLGLCYFLRGMRGTWLLCKGSDVRPGVPWSPLLFAWQARHLVLCKGSDDAPGVPWSPPLCRWLLRGKRSTCCSARGRMYALASLGLRCSAGSFCVASTALGALQRGRRATWSAMGLMYTR